MTFYRSPFQGNGFLLKIITNCRKHSGQNQIEDSILCNDFPLLGEF